MLVHYKKRPRYKVQLPLTSLIDIVFLLRIYFLLTTNFMVNEGIKIKLPQAKASSPQTEKEITVYVDRQGRAFLGNKEISMGDLYRRLKDMI
ncbi:MAG: biopolymer transporter ExbD, partial [Deltaproteobacteria bacterium]